MASCTKEHGGVWCSGQITNVSSKRCVRHIYNRLFFIVQLYYRTEQNNTHDFFFSFVATNRREWNVHPDNSRQQLYWKVQRLDISLWIYIVSMDTGLFLIFFFNITSPSLSLSLSLSYSLWPSSTVLSIVLLKISNFIVRYSMGLLVIYGNFNCPIDWNGQAEKPKHTYTENDAAHSHRWLWKWDAKQQRNHEIIEFTRFDEQTTVNFSLSLNELNNILYFIPFNCLCGNWPLQHRQKLRCTLYRDATMSNWCKKKYTAEGCIWWANNEIPRQTKIRSIDFEDMRTNNKTNEMNEWNDQQRYRNSWWTINVPCTHSEIGRNSLEMLRNRVPQIRYSGFVFFILFNSIFKISFYFVDKIERENRKKIHIVYCVLEWPSEQHRGRYCTAHPKFRQHFSQSMLFFFIIICCCTKKIFGRTMTLFMENIRMSEPRST